MAIEIFDMDQNSAAWTEARRGIATASRFKDILAKGEGKMRRSYLLQLAGEIVTGQAHEGYYGPDMERGHEMEGEARDFYAFRTGTEPELVGFIRNGAKGCSPDSLIDADGMLEIKTKFPHLLIDVLLKDEFPSEHKAQCQGALWVAERGWIDIAIYWPGLPLFVKRAYRDESYIAGLSAAVDAFNSELAEIVATIRAYGGDRIANQRDQFRAAVAEGAAA